ncbi:MAG: hypothetical protein KDA89_20375 [Planctomycetaceae bacterium]|nr:hypothetical protein [Planctomycetaceae bacterium]
MYSLTQFVICVALIVISVALVQISREISALRKTIASRRLFSTAQRRDTLSYAPAGTPTHGFAIYMYRQGRWHLEADLSTPGCESSPPETEGAFDGQVVRKQSMPK